MLPEVATGNTHFLGTHLKTSFLKKLFCFIVIIVFLCMYVKARVVGNEAWPVVA